MFVCRAARASFQAGGKRPPNRAALRAKRAAGPTELFVGMPEGESSTDGDGDAPNRLQRQSPHVTHARAGVHTHAHCSEVLLTRTLHACDSIVPGICPFAPARFYPLTIVLHCAPCRRSDESTSAEASTNRTRAPRWHVAWLCRRRVVTRGNVATRPQAKVCAD